RIRLCGQGFQLWQCCAGSDSATVTENRGCSSGAAWTPRHDNSDQRESPERAEPRLANENDETADPNDPIEPTDRTDPQLPIDRIEYAEPMERIDPSDAIDRIDRRERRDFEDLWCEVRVIRAVYHGRRRSEEIMRN